MTEMSDVFRDQADFLEAAEKQVSSGDIDEMLLALNLIDEEYKELKECVLFSPNQVKETIDLMYTCAQLLNVYVGPEVANKLWNAVHGNNMDKTIAGKLIKDKNGKVMKPPGFKKLTDTDIENIIMERENV